MMATAMAEMSDGFAMFGPNERIVFCNERYKALFPKSGYARKPGAHILDILKVTARSGERNDLPSDVDDHQIKIAAEKLFTDKDEIFQLADGRWLSLRTRATDENYVLALVSDITSVKESELSFESFAEQLKGLAETSALTGLANRQSFDESLVREFETAAISGRPLSTILIDVDRFKAFNDRYGPKVCVCSAC